MPDVPLVLPPLLSPGDFGGDWATYVEALWSQFRTDFLLSSPILNGRPVRVDRQLGRNGKETRFWHLVEKGEPGDSEDDRRPDYRRCERLPWIRCLLDHASSHDVEMWIDKTRKGTKVKLALADFSYLIVLKRASDHYRLITAYPIDERHERSRLQRECRRLRGH